MPKVSVIIPNYNHAPFLKQRIDSVLQQSFQDFELLILDDCSKDNSREVIELYRSHPKVSQIVYNETNSGSTFKQWQKGMELATGDYIWMAESDDYCETILLETLVNGITKYPDCTVAYCQSYYIDSSGNITYVPNPKHLEKCMNGMKFINDYLIYHSVIYNASMALFKRETYFTISRDFTEFRFCGDWIFWSEMASRGDVFMSGKLLNYFRFHGNDVSGGMYRTGRSFTEQFRCLLLLKKKFSISDETYKKAMSFYTTRYFIQKKHVSIDIRAIVNSLLAEKENRKYQLYFYIKWLQNRVGRLFQRLYKFIDPDSL